MAIELNTLIRSSLDTSTKTRWNCFDRKSLKSLRIQDIFNQSKYAHGLWNNFIVRYFVFKKIKLLLKDELCKRKIDLLPSLKEQVKNLIHSGAKPNAIAETLRQDNNFKIFKRNELELVARTSGTEISTYAHWLEEKRLLRNSLESGERVDLEAVRKIPSKKLKFKAGSPDSKTLARAVVALNFHPDLLPTMPKRVVQALQQIKEMEAYFLHMKCEALPEIADKIKDLRREKVPLLNQLEALKNDPRFFVYTDADLHLLLQTQNFYRENEWLEFKRIKLEEITEDHNMSRIVPPLLAIPEDHLSEILEYFQDRRDSVENQEWLDAAARASIAFAIYPELIPIFPIKVKQFLNKLQSLSKVGSHFQSLLLAKYKKPTIDLGKSITEESIAHEDVPIYPLFESDRKRSFNLFLQISSRPHVCFSEEKKLMEEIQFLVVKYNLDKSARIMLHMLLSTDGYGLPIASYKDALVLQTDSPFFFPLETERTPLHIKIKENEGGELHFDYVYKGVVTDAKHCYACDMDLSRTTGHLQYSLSYSMKRNPQTQQYFVEGPTLSSIQFTIDNPV